MKTQKDYSLQLSISDNAYSNKKDINWSKVTYSTSSINLNLLSLLIKSGYCFCYNFNDNHINQSQKTIKNWNNTSAIFVDIDDSVASMNDFIDNLSFKPTIAYTTFSNNDEENKYRFRLIYCFDENIDNINLFKKLYFSIINLIQSENNFNNKDNCGQYVAQQFAGNGSDKCNLNISYNIFSFNDFINNNSLDNNKNIEIRNISDNTKGQYKSIKREEETLYNCNDLFENKEYINDYWNLSFNKLLEKYKDIYPLFNNTELPQVDEDTPYILLPKNYIEIKRYWIYSDFIKDNGDVIKSTKVSKIKDGEGRKYKLFINGIIRRFIKSDITFEYLLHMLVNELYYYIENSKDKITKKQLYQIAKNSYSANLNDYQELNKKNVTKEFIVNDEYCIKYNLSRKQVVRIAKKELNFQRIGELYDFNLTDKENVEVMKEFGVITSESSIKRFRKENNITKYNKTSNPVNKSDSKRLSKENDTTILELKDNTGSSLKTALNKDNEENIEEDMNKERIEKRLQKWVMLKTKEELIQAWQSAKTYVASNAENFDERKEYDLMVEDYYWKAHKAITA